MSLDGRMETCLDYVHAAKKEIERATESGNDLERQGCIERAAAHLHRAADELVPRAAIRILSGPGVPQ
jgi:hypothetical protein